MNFVKVGQHYINLENINYVVREGKKLVIFFNCAGESGIGRPPYRLNLVQSDADEFERQLQNHSQ